VVLEFIYTTTLSFNSSNVDLGLEVLYLANRFMIRYLKIRLEDRLIRNLRDDVRRKLLLLLLLYFFFLLLSDKLMMYRTWCPSTSALVSTQLLPSFVPASTTSSPELMTLSCPNSIANSSLLSLPHHHHQLIRCQWSPC